MVSRKPQRNHSALLINEPPLQVLPSLATAIGLHEAIFAQQIHYWLQGKSGKMHAGRRWIYNTREEWTVQFPFWSKQTITRTTDSLKKQGILLTTNALNKSKMDRTLWYALDYDVLDDVSNSIHGVTLATDGITDSIDPSSENECSNHETTQETTQEITHERETPSAACAASPPGGSAPLISNFDYVKRRSDEFARKQRAGKR